MVAGRPRTTTPDPEQLIKLGEELVNWATEEIDVKDRPYRFRFAQWYSLRKGILDKEWKLMLQKEEFRPYYEQARVSLSANLTDGTIKEGLAHRFLRTYCPEVKEEEDETSRFIQSLKIEELEKLPADVLDKFTALMSQMQKNQSVNKDLTSKSAETKS